MSFYQTWKVLSHYYYKFSLFSFWEAHSMNVGPQRSLRLFCLSSSFFSVCSSDLILSAVLFLSTLILPSASSNLPLSSSSDYFFHFNYGILYSRIYEYFWFLFRCSTSLLIFLFCSHIVFFLHIVLSFFEHPSDSCFKVFVEEISH